MMEYSLEKMSVLINYGFRNDGYMSRKVLALCSSE